MIKQSDIAVIILVASLSLVASYFIGDAVINTESNRSTNVELVTPISSEFPQPSTTIFNDDAINPTEIIRIGENQSSDEPFNQQND